MSYPERKALAARVREAARQHRAMYAAPGDTLVSGDCRELREIAGLIRLGKRQQAAMKAHYLDTIVRDSIPGAVWDWLEARP